LWGLLNNLRTDNLKLIKMRNIIFLFVASLTLAGCMTTAPVARKGKAGGLNSPAARQNTVTQSTTPAIEAGPVDESQRFIFSFDYGKAGLQIPKFTDLNSSVQDAYKIRSHDLLVQFGYEKILGKSEMPGPLTFGVKGKPGVAITYLPTQQGAGEPGNYFASNGSFYNTGKGLHSGDIINIMGFWWSFTPELASHYSLSPNFEIGAAVGLSLYGYAGMTIKDPWTSYKTNISDKDHVWHSAFLTNHFKSFNPAFAWSFNILIKNPSTRKRVFLEIGNTGPIFNFGIGTETLLSGKNK
jgi:hypothetical protein